MKRLAASTCNLLYSCLLIAPLVPSTIINYYHGSETCQGIGGLSGLGFYYSIYYSINKKGLNRLRLSP